MILSVLASGKARVLVSPSHALYTLDISSFLFEGEPSCPALIDRPDPHPVPHQRRVVITALDKRFSGQPYWKPC